MIYALLCEYDRWGLGRSAMLYAAGGHGVMPAAGLQPLVAVEQVLQAGVHGPEAAAERGHAAPQRGR